MIYYDQYERHDDEVKRKEFEKKIASKFYQDLYEKQENTDPDIAEATKKEFWNIIS